MKTIHELKCATRPSSVVAVHNFIDHHLSSLDPDKVWLPDLHVIIDELASNIEKYAYGADSGPYLVRINLENGHVEVDFEDEGNEFDPTQVKELPIDGHHDRSIGNLGVLLVMGLADGVRYSRRGRKNVTTVAMSISNKKFLQNGDQ